ncbi:MAG: ABC transporter ATP-binding protein [Rhodospirillales bacterium]|nr:ABC transporter ATP-binding protein [Rhodospirillales bacterium]
MIVLEKLSKSFGQFTAVDGIDLAVPKGEVLGFLGPNGAGKSTTMKMISGFLEPSSGSARVAGFDIAQSPVEVKRRIGYMPEGAPSYGEMTAATFLSFVAEIRGFRGAEKNRRIDETVDRVRLAEVFHQPIDTLSKGFKRRVGLAQAMLHDPEVLILDEPTDGLDPNQKHHVRGLIKEMARDKAIIISTHILEEVEAVCSRAVIIAQGRLLADGTPEELLARDPHHQALVITPVSGSEDQVRAALAAMGQIEAITGRDHQLRLTGASHKDVSAAIRDKNLQIEELYVERGTLDDVFRQITAPRESAHA